jgi:hypothetical protein
MPQNKERLLKYYVWNDMLQVMVMALTPVEACIHALSFKGINSTAEAKSACSDFITWDSFYVDQRGFRDRAEVIAVTVGLNGVNSIDEVVSGASAMLTRDQVLPWVDIIHAHADPFCEYEDEGE